MFKQNNEFYGLSLAVALGMKKHERKNIFKNICIHGFKVHRYLSGASIKSISLQYYFCYEVFVFPWQLTTGLGRGRDGTDRVLLGTETGAVATLQQQTQSCNIIVA